MWISNVNILKYAIALHVKTCHFSICAFFLDEFFESIRVWIYNQIRALLKVFYRLFSSKYQRIIFYEKILLFLIFIDRFNRDEWSGVVSTFREKKRFTEIQMNHSLSNASAMSYVCFFSLYRTIVFFFILRWLPPVLSWFKYLLW